MRLFAAACVLLALTSAAQAAEPVVALSPEAQKALLTSKDPQLAANKKLVWDMWRTFLQGGDIDAADKSGLPTGRSSSTGTRPRSPEAAGTRR